MTYLLSVLAVLVVISAIPIVLSDSMRGDFTIPNWVKNTAGWWADDKIPDSAFIQGIQFLIKEEIITVQIPAVDSVVEEIPGWVKNTAGWWADDKIQDITFVAAVRYLVSQGIVYVEREQVEEPVEEVEEITDFYMEVNGSNCCLNWAYVGKDYNFQIETFDKKHGNQIDGVTITAKIISKGGELRHDFGQVITEDGFYGNSIIIPSMDWYAGNILSVTGEYYGVEKTIEKEFEVFKQRDGTSGSYGAGAGDCALVAPVSVNSNGESETNPHGITFSKSGTKMFMIGNADTVFEYELTNPYCIANVSTPLKKDISTTGSGNPTGIVFDPSGTKMFIVGSEGTNKGEVNTYNLAEPYLVTSALHASVYTMSFTDANPSGIAFDNSGTKMFISDQGTDTIRAYALQVPYVTSSNSTGDSDTPSLSMTDVGGSVRDIWFDASGTKLFILEQGAKDVTVFKLAVPFVLSSATIVS